MGFEQADRINLDQMLAKTASTAQVVAELLSRQTHQGTNANQQDILQQLAELSSGQSQQATIASQETIQNSISALGDSIGALGDDVVTNQAVVVSLLRSILNLLSGVFRPPSKPVRLFLGFPTFTNKLTGEPMANTLAMLDTQVAHIAIMTQNAEGVVVPASAGDVDSVASADSTQFTAVIGADANGNPEMQIAPQVQTNSAGVAITLTDSAGLTPFVFTATCGRDTVPKSLFGNLAGVTFTTQPEPTAPGPG